MRKVGARKTERRLARALEAPFVALLEHARGVARTLEDVEAFLRSMNARVDEIRLGVKRMVRESGEESARTGYDRTVKDLGRLRVPARSKPLGSEAHRELVETLGTMTDRMLDPYPRRLYTALDLLRSNKSTRPLARKLARGLAKAASTYAEVRGELAANEEQGTGYWKWKTVGDEHVRRAHRKANGEVRRIGTLFSTECRHPRDPLGPIGQTINCRCRTEPALPPKKRGTAQDVNADQPGGANYSGAGGGGSGGGSRRGGGPGGGGGYDPEEVRRYLDSLLRPANRLIGEPFRRRNPYVRRVTDDDYEPDSFEDFFLELARYGEVQDLPEFNGMLVEMPEVGTLGYRPISRSGHPTIDVTIPGIGIRELKYEQRENS